GHVSSREMHRFARDAAACGKQSFEYAWVLDEGSDERERGVTIDVCVKHFTTPKGTRVTLLDAPGHKDFVPNMLLGAVQADFAIVLADVKDFDKGFTRGGQTKEHIRLLRALGITKIIVAINKMDLVGSIGCSMNGEGRRVTFGVGVMEILMIGVE
ncbi:HBS1-like protein, partial [Perkinsus olseni]